jgi:hypothetical protein
MDLDWARAMIGPRVKDEVLLITMHKARYECAGIEAKLRLASRRWLKQRGFTRLAGLPWPTDGSLPK